MRVEAKKFIKMVSGARTRQKIYLFKKISKKNFSPFYFASPEIIEVKICNRRQTNSLTPYTGVCGFFPHVKFATSLLASLAGG